MCAHRHTWRSWASNLQEQFIRRMLPCSPVWQMFLKRSKFLGIWPSLWNGIANIFWLQFAVSLVAGTKLPEIPVSPSSRPSPPSHTSSFVAGPGITQHLSETDLQIPSHKQNLTHWFYPNQLFFLQLVMIWIDKVAQGLRRWMSSVAWWFGTWGRATHVVSKSVERVSTKLIKP